MERLAAAVGFCGKGGSRAAICRPKRA